MQWFATTGEDLIEPEYFPRSPARWGGSRSRCDLRPDREWHVMRQLYFTLITSAERTVYIQSRSSSSTRAWPRRCARPRSRRGRARDDRPRGSVRAAGVPAGRTYANEMSHAGVRVYEYQGAYFHPKTVCIDSSICVVGSVNLDIRSFSINYESRWWCTTRA